MPELEKKNAEALEWLDAIEIGIDLSHYCNETCEQESDDAALAG